MIAHALLKRFDLLVETPGNIPLLRRFVIDLAVCGKLVEGSDETRSPRALLALILDSRARMAKAGKIAKQNYFPPISESEVPPVYAAQCVFERLGNIAILRKGLTGIQNAQPGSFPLVVTAETRSSSAHYDFEGAAAIIPMVSSSGHGDASLKRIHYQEGKFALGNILCAVFPISPDLITARFLFEYLRAFKDELIVSRMIGTANVSLTLGKIGEIPVPIVSPAVQRRLDEIMALCDRLEDAQREREIRRDRLKLASLRLISNGGDVESLRTNIQFCLSHLPQITAQPEDISALRQSILTLAVQGKLVQQNPTDNSSESLLSNLRQLREKSENRSKNSSVNDSDPKFVQHLPAKLPKGWVACPLEDLFRFIDYRGRTPTRTARGVRLITAKNVRMGHIANDPVEYIDEQAYKSWMTRGFPQNGDLLFVTEGATMGYIGTIEMQFVFALAQRTINLQPYLRDCSRFFLFTIMSTIFQEAVLTNSTGTAVKGIKAAKLKRIRVPLPPLAEQRRIVAKVEQLMAICDRLEAQLTSCQTKSRQLLDAVLHQDLSGTPLRDALPLEMRH